MTFFFQCSLLFKIVAESYFEQFVNLKYPSGLSLQFSESLTRAIVAFDPDQWSEWYKDDPKLANLDNRPPGKKLVRDSQKFLDTGGDVFFLLKSNFAGEVEKVLQRVENNMKNFCDNLDVTHSQPPSKVRI